MAKEISRRINKPNISQVTHESQLLDGFNQVVEALLPLVGQNQDKLERAVTFKDLEDGGFTVGFTAGGTPIIDSGVGGEDEQPNLRVPPPIANLQFSATTNTILMFWDAPAYSNHSFVEIWRAPATKNDETQPQNPDGSYPQIPTGLADAYYLNSSLSIAYADRVFPGESWRYWLRNVSDTGVKGPWQNDDGTVVSSVDDPRYILDQIEGSITEGDLSQELADKTGALDDMWTVKIDAGNAVAGIGLGISDTGQTEFIIRADRFAVVPPVEFDINGAPIVGDATIPFYVVNDGGTWRTRIKNAVIDTAFIDSLVANGITADRVNALNLNAVNITGGSISIGGRFSVNSTSVSVTNATLNCNNRFIVSPNGTVTIRDQTANVGLKIFSNYIAVYDNAGVVRVRIGQL